MAASLAPVFASLSLSLPAGGGGKGGVAAGGVSLGSSFSGQKVSGLVCAKRKVAVRPLGFSVRAKGGFIPAEHRWMYEGIENKGAVSILVLLCVFLYPDFALPVVCVGMRVSPFSCVALLSQFLLCFCFYMFLCVCVCVCVCVHVYFVLVFVPCQILEFFVVRSNFGIGS